MKRNNTKYFIVIFLVFIGFKYLFSIASTSNVLFILKPINTIVSTFFNSSSIYSSELGFYHKMLHITIDKSCSGVNLLLITFLSLCFVSIHRLKKPSHKIISLFISLLFSYLFTVFTNSFRIISSIYIQNLSFDFIQSYDALIHKTIGILINLTFLIITYTAIDNKLKKIQL